MEVVVGGVVGVENLEEDVGEREGQCGELDEQCKEEEEVNKEVDGRQGQTDQLVGVRETGSTRQIKKKRNGFV